MKKMVLLLPLVLLFPGGAFAADAVSLKEAMTMALEKNHILRAADYEYKAVGEEVKSSRSRYLPRIYLDETLSYSNLPTRTFMMKLDQGRFTQNDFQIANLNNPAATGDFRTAVTLEQALFDVTVSRGLDISRKEQEIRRSSLERRREEIGFLVFQAYIEVQKARAFLKVAEQGLTDAREHKRLADVRNESGVGLVSDKLRARTRVSEMEQENITAINNLQLSRMRLSQLLGGENGVLYDIKEDIEPISVMMDVSEFQVLARQNRRELQEVDKGVEKADMGLGMARGAYLPKIYGNAGYQMNSRDIPFGRDNDGWMVSANLRWDIFDGMRRGSELEKASLQKSAAEEYRNSYLKEVEFQVSEAYLRRTEAGKRLEVARHSQLDAEEVVRLVAKRFENSLATMVDLLDAQTAVDRARAQRVENETNYALATARLFQATGIFLQEVVK